MRMPLLSCTLAALLLTLGPASDASGQSGRVRAELTADPGSAPAGTAIDVQIQLRIMAGWHIQAGEGSGDEQPPYIATTVKLRLPRGWTQGPVQWPDAHHFALGFGEFAEQLAGYEGTATVHVPVTIPADAAAGDHALRAEIGYQACDDSVCEGPTSLDVQGTVEVTVATVAPAADPVAAAAPDAVLSGYTVWYEDALAPGATGTLGIVLETAGPWHIQAGRGSGDESGDYIATEIELELPGGWTAGDVAWPASEEFQFGEGEYTEILRGYHGRAVAAVHVTVPDDAEIEGQSVRVRVRYQACDDSVCLDPATLAFTGGMPTGELDPEMGEQLRATLQRSVTAAPDSGSATKGATRDSGFDLSRSKWWLSLAFVWAACIWMVYRTLRVAPRPVPLFGTGFVAVVLMWGMFAFTRAMTATPVFDWIHYTPEAFDAARADQTVFVKFTADWCPNCIVNERIIMGNEDAVARLSSAGVAPMKVDFTTDDPAGQALLDSVDGGAIPVIAVWPVGEDDPIVIRGLLPGAGSVIRALDGIGVKEEAGTVNFNAFFFDFRLGKGAAPLVLVLAFVAGFILNFTPCVLPVVPLKVLSLQAHAKDPARCLALGITFCLGIMAVFAVLGVFIAGIVAGAQQVGWGGHFKLWWVSAIIGVIVGAMGFGMLGLFVIRLPKAVYMFNPQSDSHPGSFAMGAFTAILSTPCTGPLLGGVLAFMALFPAWVGLTTMLFMGAGMAAPYLLLTARPKLLDRLPRTGPGSEIIKQVMGLLLMAVAVYFLGTALVGLGM